MSPFLPGLCCKPGKPFPKPGACRILAPAPGTAINSFSSAGSLLGGKSPTRVRELAPGEVTDISVELSAPGYQGDYAGVWRLQTEKGSLFGPEFSFSIRIPQPTPTRTQTPSPSATFTPTLTYTHTPDPTRPAHRPAAIPNRHTHPLAAWLRTPEAKAVAHASDLDTRAYTELYFQFRLSKPCAPGSLSSGKL